MEIVMSADYAVEAVVMFGLLFVFLLILAIGCAVADYVFPRIPFIRRFLDGLPEFEDDKEIAKLYENARKAKTEERSRRRAARRRG